MILGVNLQFNNRVEIWVEIWVDFWVEFWVRVSLERGEFVQKEKKKIVRIKTGQEKK